MIPVFRLQNNHEFSTWTVTHKFKWLMPTDNLFQTWVCKVYQWLKKTLSICTWKIFNRDIYLLSFDYIISISNSLPALTNSNSYCELKPGLKFLKTFYYSHSIKSSLFVNFTMFFYTAFNSFIRIQAPTYLKNFLFHFLHWFFYIRH